MNTIEQFAELVDNMTVDFVNHMFADNEDPEYYWIAGDITGTLEINDTYWNLGDIYNILKKQYPRDKVFAWYDYSIYYSSNDNSIGREYYINMDHFMRLYDGEMEVKEFARIYREKRDKDQFYWESKEGQEKNDKDNEEIKEKYLLPYLKENDKQQESDR